MTISAKPTSGPNASESPVSQELCNDLRAILCVLLIRSWRPVCGTRHLIFESGR